MIHDVYYDLHEADWKQKKDILAGHGIWVRQRSGSWQTKQRVPSSTRSQGNPYIRTIVNEISCPKKIHGLLSRYISTPPLDNDPQRNFGLHPVVDFIAFREKYLADDRFQVVLDEICLGYRAGEVELLVPPGGKPAQRDIDGLMERYGWFFWTRGEDGSAVKGKLSAHFERFPDGI